MKKYEAVIILNPNLSSKVDTFKKDFEDLLKQNSFSINKTEDIGRRQLSYSINNHNKGHYIIFSIEGNPVNLINIENKIKYNDSIIRHLFISVKNHQGEDSQLMIDSKNKKDDSDAETPVIKDKEKDVLSNNKQNNTDVTNSDNESTVELKQKSEENHENE
jgi:small subunit ribosomal protein S6